ncbi:MAG: carbamoyltransferase HypF [Planctomycetaceae bacterium]
MDVPALIARQLHLRGTVQGRGLRPQLLRRARELGLLGWVENTVAGVDVVVVGSGEAVCHFAQFLTIDFHPPLRVESIPLDLRELPPVTDFCIRDSVEAGALATPIPLDRAVCAECLAEVQSPSRRTGYLLTTCAECGPRFSLTEQMPFDRSRTTLRDFPHCPACAAEYDDPADRRCHAQTIGCAQCGPNWWLLDPRGPKLPAGEPALEHVLQELRRGKIVALRGVGGYQLLCVATNSAAVSRLRTRKQRPAKPLAVMVADWIAACALAEWDELAQRTFESPANPIVLVPAKPGNGLAKEIHPGIREVGVMAPTTPWHAEVLRRVASPLVVTSGNLDGDPLVVDVAEAETRLGEVADLFVHHNRPICHPVDDSVVRVMAGKVVTLRLARGLAPLVLPSGPWENVPRLALGGGQKVALALANGRQAILGPHLGDLRSVLCRERYGQQVSALRSLFRVPDCEWVHDSHPDDATTHMAQESSQPAVRVDHHQAHLLAGMLEAGWTDREVVGVAFDGTGWGSEGQLWGGEFLVVTGGDYQRVGNLRPLQSPGGERAVREPWRVALGLLAETLPRAEMSEIADRLFPEGWRSLWNLLQRIPMGEGSRWCPLTSSIGRLFDGVAALVLGLQEVSYEGEAAQRLESLAEEPGELLSSHRLPLTMVQNRWELDWRPMIRWLVADLRNGCDPRRLAGRFHAAVAEAVVEVAQQMPGYPVVLSGGCFQNRLLVELIAHRMAAVGQPLFTPGSIPPNDGGLAAGQLVAASMQSLANRDMIRG